MTQRTLTDQPSILRLLVEQGVDGKIKPMNPEFPGTCGFFQDITDQRKWFIIDRVNDFYTATILEDCGVEEAAACLTEYVHRFLDGPGDVRFKDLPVPTPAKN